MSRTRVKNDAELSIGSINLSSIATDVKGVIQIFNVLCQTNARLHGNRLGAQAHSRDGTNHRTLPVRKSSIKRNLQYIGATIIAGIIGATLIIIHAERVAAIDAFSTATNNLADGMSRQTAQFFGSTDAMLKKIQTALRIAPKQRSDEIDAIFSSHATFGLLKDLQARSSNLAEVFVVDLDGKVASSSRDGGRATQANVALTDYFVHFKSTDDHDVFICTPVRDSDNGEWVVPMVRRLNDLSGRFAGVVVADISVKELQRFYEMAMPSRRTIYVARRDGIILVRYPDRPGEIGNRIPAHSIWYTIVAQGSGHYEAPSYFDAHGAVASVRSLSNLPLVVETSVAESIVLSDWDKQKYWIGLVCLLFIVCSIGLLHLFGVQYSRIEKSKINLAQINAELDRNNRQLEVILANLSQGVCFFDANNMLLVCNETYCQLLGLPRSSVRSGMSLLEISKLQIAAGTFSNQTIEAYMASIDELLRDGKPRDEITELADGRTLAKHFQPLPGYGWVMTQEDISGRRAAELRISFLAHHDMLTGLANRVLFQDRLAQALAHAKRGKGFALLCLDLDRFKAVNDTYGHSVGDGILRAVAARLRVVVREGDTIARLGGDEFVILQTEVSDAASTSALACRIVETINERFHIENHDLSIGVSIGISVAPSDGTDAERLMRNADSALYRSKREGRGTWRFFKHDVAANPEPAAYTSARP